MDATFTDEQKKLVIEKAYKKMQDKVELREWAQKRWFWRIVYFCSYQFESQYPSLMRNQALTNWKFAVKTIVILQVLSRMALGNAMLRRAAVLQCRLAPQCVNIEAPSESNKGSAAFRILHGYQAAVERDISRLRYRLRSMRVAEDLGIEYEKVTYAISIRQRERMARLGNFGVEEIVPPADSDSDSNMD